MSVLLVHKQNPPWGPHHWTPWPQIFFVGFIWWYFNPHLVEKQIYSVNFLKYGLTLIYPHLLSAWHSKLKHKLSKARAAWIFEQFQNNLAYCFLIPIELLCRTAIKFWEFFINVKPSTIHPMSVLLPPALGKVKAKSKTFKQKQQLFAFCFALKQFLFLLDFLLFIFSGKPLLFTFTLFF